MCLCEISLKVLDPLWMWFENNEDGIFRVSLLLARMNMEDIDQELIKLRPSSGLQRLPSVYEPNQGYTSPRISSPSIVGSGLSVKAHHMTVKARILELLETNVYSKARRGRRLIRKLGASQEETNTTRKRTPLVPEHRRKSDIKEEDEEDEDKGDEPSIVLVAERTRRPYNGSPSQQEAKKLPEQRTVPLPTTGGRPYVPYVPPRIPRRYGAESTQSMP